MRARRTVAALAALVVALAAGRPAAAQPADSSRKWEILDNSFLVEESFNQERGVFQNIFTWTRQRGGAWDASFTQEWPAPGTAHQLSYTLPFAATGDATGLGDLLLNYRYQVREETQRGPALSPRLSVIIPTGRSDEGLGSGVGGLEINVPASKQFGDFYVHANVGFTWLPDVQRTPHIGGSGIWRVAPLLNLMLEAIVEIDESATLSPGFRRGWNIGDHQLVIGAALPLTREAGETTAALLTYISYELPFRR
jgi:outer membrane putative beta-barrel porin/alpha-amylase